MVPFGDADYHFPSSVVRVHAGLGPKQVPPSNVLRLEFVKAATQQHLYRLQVSEFSQTYCTLSVMEIEKSKQKKNVDRGSRK